VTEGKELADTDAIIKDGGRLTGKSVLRREDAPDREDQIQRRSDYKI
jgi:hypothetical protein